MTKRAKVGALIGVVIGVPVVGLAVFIYLLRGPCSQASLVMKYETHNLDAIQRAGLPTADVLPFARPELPRKWGELVGFKPPVWPANRMLQLFSRNGPLEGTPYRKNRGIVFNGITMVETHGWINGKDFGLAYTTTTNRLPSPYWTKHLIGNWSVWYTDGNAPPRADGLWYE
jgi:hypothetical protein